jgi:hypothetical protein
MAPDTSAAYELIRFGFAQQVEYFIVLKPSVSNCQRMFFR